ncbi:MAG: metallophosphoesterase family protein [Candidatus Dormibacterales bacterium]
MRARVGLVADTHSPEFLDRLPKTLMEAFKGVDLILHAGDVGGRETLSRLGRLAPVEAVRGDHDRGLPGLPDARQLEIAGVKVALVHGNRGHLIEEPVTFVSTVTLGYLWPMPDLGPWLLRRFPEADVIVHGHTHFPSVRRSAGKLIVNPGAVYQVTPEAARRRLEAGPGWFEWTWLQVTRHRRRASPSTAAILEIGPDGLTTEIVRL